MTDRNAGPEGDPIQAEMDRLDREENVVTRIKNAALGLKKPNISPEEIASLAEECGVAICEDLESYPKEEMMSRLTSLLTLVRSHSGPLGPNIADSIQRAVEKKLRQ